MTTPAVTTTASRRGPWRWFVALIATVLLVVSGSGLVVFAASGDAEAQGPEWVAAGAPVYVEARVDMAGGQGDAVAQMLTAFPLFADANSFELKMDEAFDGAIAGASGGAMTWTGDIESVVTGEMGLALPDLESAVMGSEPTVLVGVAHSDAALSDESYSYDAGGNRWHGSAGDDSFPAQALAWYEGGASIIGGCCRVGPAGIARLKALWG